MLGTEPTVVSWKSLVEAGAVLLLGLAFLASCGGGGSSVSNSSTPITDNRLLSISATPRSEPAPTSSDILAAIDMAYNAGVRGQYQFATWSSLEPQVSGYDLAPLVDGINFLTNRGFTQILVTVAPINTTTKETPGDLQPLSFNSSETETRFHALLDVLLPQLPSSVVYLSIGNEVDIYLAAHPDEWTTYTQFYEDAETYIHQKWPQFKVGSTVTFAGAVGTPAAEVANLTADSDILVFTYYPVGTNFRPLGPQSPALDFPRMEVLGNGRPVALQEVGYPSSPFLGSSETEQSQFVSAVFQAWKGTASHIPFMNYFLLHDFSDTQCDEFTTYYGSPGDPYFHDFLCSLGLRQSNGTAKLGWQTFVDRASQDGFPH